ncbi:ketopantoate reductase family protein [Isoptericola sp. 178]|uniref:ketopantoate reductase family protein n=1 Tax=Isoptericola sp. 178 TaxID=3064651 RepID=UPI002712CCC0|nr:2-dehydropantoate 2-reductase [Isoptericola sp. 178]MDO8145919.1 2-dehydropantoate 2-reductase [Isoptericola sp. 178]
MPERTSRRSTIAVLGPGGVGGLVGALAARAGHRVIVLAGPETASTLRSDGLRVTSGFFGDFSAEVEADTELREPVDLCLVAVKHPSLPEALERVPAEHVAAGLVVPLLNGVEHVATLRERFAPASVAAGVIRVESTRTAPGRIVHGSPFVEVDLASSTAPPERLEAAATILRDAGVTTLVRDDEGAMLWGKLGLLAPFALLTTYHGEPIGTLRTERRDTLAALVAEVAAIGQAGGGPDTSQTALRFYDTFPPEARSSMQRDAEAGRPLELDAIGGAVLRAADRHEVPAPLTRRLVTELGRSSTSSPGASTGAGATG